MQRYYVRVWGLVLAFGASLTLLGAPQPAMRDVEPGLQKYCNEKYMHCVSVPSSGKVEPHEDDAPNHGVTINLPEQGNVAWTYAEWDAALLESSQKALLRRLKISLDKHPTAEVRVAPTVIGGLPAYRIQLNYTETLPTIEELVIAYRKPRTESEWPGIIYEIGLKCSKSSYPANVSVLEALISSFKLTGE